VLSRAEISYEELEATKRPASRMRGVLRQFVLPSGDPRAVPAGAPRGEVVAPRAAATVMLVRDTADGIEVFVLRRRTAMAFAAGMHVFPGGGVDARDAGHCPWHGPAPDGLAPLLSASPQEAQALVVAAVRETFEECGVLLATPAAQNAPSVVAAGPGTDSGAGPDLTGHEWEQARQALAEGTVALGDLLDRHALVLRADLLHPWAHWLTPEAEPRRFDTRFFVAELPAGQCAREVLGEADRAGWVLAREALERSDAGEVALMPPTRVCLEEIAAAPDVRALVAAPRRPQRVTPWLGLDDDGRTVVVVDLDGVGGGAAVTGLS
jgi:8-oxo-dGTP pyrophosphatase MutT (NUDIX family)